MDALINEYGISTIGWVVVLVALPLGLLGRWLRWRSRARLLELAELRGQRRALGDVGPGPVAVTGVWRGLARNRGLVEERGGEHRVLVERAPLARPIADGTEVLVAGLVTRREPDPRPVGYRGAPHAWVVDARGPSGLVSPALDALDRAHARARLFAQAGALLVAAGVMLAVTSSLLVWRAAHDPTLYGAPLEPLE